MQKRGRDERLSVRVPCNFATEPGRAAYGESGEREREIERERESEREREREKVRERERERE